MAGNKATEIPKVYEAKNVEDSIYKMWEESGFFNPDNLPGKREKSFTISMPPPNATGVLHIGHAVMLSIQDTVIRFARMQGKKTLWLPGTDHAAIATNAKVEQILKEKEKKTRHDLGREEFLKRVDEYVVESQATIKNQIRKMGSSCDWSRERYTLDEGLTKAVQHGFVAMYEDGLIYRGDRIVNWCPRCASTLADDEVEFKEERTPFYYFKYGPVIIGTARPETKFGDKVIIVHPDDDRYKDLVGKEVEVEWILGKIKAKVIADKAADPEMGSGAMTITPGHSFVDFDLAQKYNIPIEKIIDENGKLTELAGDMEGMNIKEARHKVFNILKDKGLVEKVDEEYVHNLSVCYRCGTAVEPLVSRQWFVDVKKPLKKFGGKSIKDRAIEVVKNGDIQIIPERFNKTYFHWMENLRDWCISRQIWFGHQMPVWYRKNIKSQKSNLKTMGFHERVVPQIFAGKTKTYRLYPKDIKVGEEVAFENSQAGEIFGSGKIIDIVETTVGKIPLGDKAHGETYNKVEELINAFKRHYSEMEITSDTKAYIYTYDFKPSQTSEEIYVGLDEPKGEGWKKETDTLDTWFSSGMWTFSTLGWPDKTNDLKTFHPTQFMETGYDIIFFWVARMIIMSTYLVEEIPFEKVYLHGLVRDEEGRKMSKSLGNIINPLDTIKKYGADATRLSLIIGITPGNDTNMSEAKIEGYRNFVNKLWNISRYILMNIEKVELVEKAPKPKTLADKWILAELNDLIEHTTNNLEKYNFSSAGEKIYDFTWAKLADWYVEIAKIEKDKDEILLYILQVLLKLWHPFMPYVTEEIWKKFDAKDLLMIQSWPKAQGKIAKTEVKNFEIIKDLVVGIRNLRTQAKVPPAKQLKIVIASPKFEQLIKDQDDVIKRLARLDSLSVSKDNKKPAESLSSVVSAGQIYLPVSGMMDIGKEIKRLEEESKRVEDFTKHLEDKLKNERFLERAPADIIENEKIKLTDHKEKLEQIKQQLQTLK